MNKGTIKVGGLVVCWVHKWAGVREYEVHFPPEETLKSFYFASISEVHQWLDEQYGASEWVVE